VPPFEIPSCSVSLFVSRYRQSVSPGTDITKGIAVPPSPAPSAALRHQELSTPVAVIPRTPATNHNLSTNVHSSQHADSASTRHQSASETSLLPVEIDRGTARTLPISAHDFSFNATDNDARLGSGRLTPELDATIDGQYLGPSSAQSFLGKALQRHEREAMQNPVTSRDTHVETETSTLSFGDVRVRQPDIAKFAWPEYRTATILLERFFEFASPTYRYMHEPSMQDWLERMYNKADVPIATQACILLIFASACVFTVDRYGDLVDADHQGWDSSEMYYQKAEALLSQETGPPRLESVQARFAAVQYLLSSSRPNKALFTFGTMITLMQTLGIHRKQSEKAGGSEIDSIVVEVRRRLFWCAFTLDKYLSIVMGRSPLLHVDFTNQALPMIVNDEDLTLEGVRQQKPAHSRDSLLHATRAHVEIGLILARASQEQNRLPTTTGRIHVEAAVRGRQDIRDWQSKLTPMMSGAIHPGSLIPCFRRQHGILTLARLHAIMFVTRPLLLRDLSNDLSKPEVRQYRDHLSSCICAARETVESIIGSARYRVLYPAFWFSQYVAFSAISIIHIYVIQLSRKRIPANLFDPASYEGSPMHIKALYELALAGQGCLTEAGVNCAPVWRYGPILESLSAQTSRYITSQVNDLAHQNSESVPQIAYSSTNSRVEQPASQVDQASTNTPHDFAIPSLEMDATWTSGYESLWDNLVAGDITENNLTMDFWPQFDNLPIGMS
jgi:hypothetical protein